MDILSQNAPTLTCKDKKGKDTVELTNTNVIEDLLYFKISKFFWTVDMFSCTDIYLKKVCASRSNL